jgi:hypothetical protein
MALELRRRRDDIGTDNGLGSFDVQVSIGTIHSRRA